MNDDWLESMGLACLVAIVFAALFGLCALALVQNVAVNIPPAAVSGFGTVLALEIAFPLGKDVLHVCTGLFLGTSPRPQLRIGGLLLFSGAVARLLGP